VHISTTRCTDPSPSPFVRRDRSAGPRSPYSASKAGSDLIALSYFTTYGCRMIITRSSTIRPVQYPRKVIRCSSPTCSTASGMPLYGDGLNVRDWCYVEDNCAALDLVCALGMLGEIYNIGAGKRSAHLDLTDRLLRIIGLRPDMTSTSRTAGARPPVLDRHLQDPPAGLVPQRQSRGARRTVIGGTATIVGVGTSRVAGETLRSDHGAGGQLGPGLGGRVWRRPLRRRGVYAALSSTWGRATRCSAAITTFQPDAIVHAARGPTWMDAERH